MNYKQASYYELQFPITDSAGGAIGSLLQANFTMYKQGVAVLEQSIGDGLTFSASTITAILDSTITVGLVGRYDCELWVQTDDGKKILTYDDALYFEATKTRI